MIPTLSGNDVPLTMERWENGRRQEILRLFQTHVYGQTPKESAHECGFSLAGPVLSEDRQTLVYALTTSVRKGDVQCSFPSELYVPAGATGPLPAVIMVDPFSQNPQIPKEDARLYGQMPYDLLNRAGLIGVHAHVDAACPDDPQAYRTGLMEIYARRGETGWGAIGAWAFLASRVVDFLVGWPGADAGRIAICGCSRAGKAALWCSAQDDRIGLTISNVSGCTGAAITRGKTGERIRDITERFPHWMCDRYAGYRDDEERLPVDQHMLLALCGPRPLYVSSASQDEWADPRKEFEAASLAGEIQALYGGKGLAIHSFPPVNTPSHAGDVAYHNREGAHGCTPYDWEQYIRFIKKYF